MFYGIIGTGAIGGYYGAKLAWAGKDVHFLLHSDYEQVAANGLQVDSVAGSFTLPAVNAYRRAADMPPCDVVLVGLKTVNQHLLPTLLPPLLKPDTLVVLIQNGVGVEAAVQQMFPHVQLAAGLAFICVAKNRPGVVEHLDKGSIDIGNYSCRMPPAWPTSWPTSPMPALKPARWNITRPVGAKPCGTCLSTGFP